MKVLATVQLPMQFNELIEKVTHFNVVNTLIVGRNSDLFTLPEEGLSFALSELGENYAAFAPKSKTILINMDGVATNQRWIKRGIRLSTSVWLSLLEGFFHELTHAYQLNEEPELIELYELSDEYENEATAASLAMTIAWLADHDLPRIEEMGYLGQLVLNVYQSLLPNLPDKVKEDLQLNGTNAAAKLTSLAVLTNEIEANEIDRLKSHIDEGLIGQKVNNDYYLTAYEAVSCE